MFKRSNFCHVASNNRNNVKSGVFIYRTTDNLATVSANGYFNDMIIDINLHDLIIHEQIDASDSTKVERNLLAVSAKSLDNINTVVVQSKWEKDIGQQLDGFVKIDGSSVMTGPLRTSALNNGENINIPATGGTLALIEDINDKITNYIAEIPQNIKLELNAGVLTVKAGSKSYVPNGASNFTEITLTQDAIVSMGGGTGTQYFIFIDSATTVARVQVQSCYSGDSAPTFSGSAVWYDTANNIIKYSSDSGATWINMGFSLPIAVATPTTGAWETLDQVFNGFGYIGATVFVLPEVKYAFPYGRNADGSLKSGNGTISSVQIATRDYAFAGVYLYMRLANNNPIQFQTSYREVNSLPATANSGDMVYLIPENRLYAYGSGVWQNADGWCMGPRFIKKQTGGTGISSFETVYPLHLVDYNGFKDVSFRTNRTSTERCLADRFDDFISVKDFGAIGDGLHDDTQAINNALAYIKSNVASRPSVCLDLCGGKYKVTGSLNATLISSWGWGIKNGTIIGCCAGKAVLDLTGSRGYHISNIYIIGDQTDMPRVGIQCARANQAGYDFCDNSLYENINTDGYFSLAAIYTYGQESTTHLKCQYWNQYNDGYAAIHTGKNFEPYQSDFVTPITGDTSFINDKYINCDYRLFPTQKSITGITQANPCVVTVADASVFSVGDSITFNDIVGMTELNCKRFTISAINGNNITINTDSTGYTAYTSGGYAIKGHTKATILLGRMAQHNFDHCYAVNYGEAAIEYRADSIYPLTEDLTLDFLFEGFGAPSLIKINTSADFTFKQTLIKTYGSWFENYMISQTGSQTIYFKGSTIDWGSTFRNSPVLFDDTSKYYLYGVSLNIPNSSVYDYSHYHGITYAYNTNAPMLRNVEYDKTRDNIANWSSNVSNCITEIPQDINLELNNGTLTLKAGSKCYLKTDTSTPSITVASDLTTTQTTDGSYFAIYDGATLTTVLTTVYDYSSLPSTYSLPLATVTVSSGAISSIDQVFNGLGYIGSSLFILPGVKFLRMDGKNSDGTLKTRPATISSVVVYTNSNHQNGERHITAFDETTIRVSSTQYSTQPANSYVTFDEVNNLSYSSLSISLIADLGTVTLSNYKITSFKPKTTFHAMDLTDIQDVVRTVAINKAQNGYVKLDNGLIIQWGIDTQSSSGTKTVNLPTAFSSATSYVVTTAQTNSTSTDFGVNIMVREQASTSFDWYSPANNVGGINWIAIGY